MGATQEQQAVIGLREGTHVVVANAGTGKTFTLKELWMERFLDEVHRWSRIRKLENADMVRLCRQFLATTFTVKAASELNERLYSLFEDAGLEVPTSFGRPVRLCRTLDSYLQSWVSHPIFFGRWIADDPRINNRLKALRERIPPIVLSKWIGEADNPEFTLFRKWRWAIPNEMGEFVLELVYRELTDSPIQGFNFDLRAWEEEYAHRVSSMTIESNLTEEFWLPKIQAKRKFHAQLREAERKLDQGEITDPREYLALRGYTKECRAIQGIIREFVTVMGQARVRHYDPIEHPEAIGSKYMLRQLAQARSIENLEMFLAIGRRYWELKDRLMVRDFTDNLIDFTHVVTSHRNILEPDKEYPKWLRSKYIFWDEVQDNNGFQFEVLNLLMPNKGIPYLSVAVGDPKQAIYAWRGAAPQRFCKSIERTLEKSPANVHTLTVSFRSARKVVDLGNEIVQTLPSYAKTVFPSSTVVRNEGEIHLSPILYGDEHEAAWVLSQIDRLMFRNAKESIMIIARSDPSEHPVSALIKEHYPEANVSYLTIHRAKGLEADNVFVLGLTAGKFPDMRSDDADAEINLFYVACTRPKTRLFLSAPTVYETVDSEGNPKEVQAGPSPFLWKVPTLRKLALEAKWPRKTLEDSERLQMGIASGVFRKAQERFEELVIEAAGIFGDQAVDDAISSSTTIFDHGSLELLGRIDNGDPEPIRQNTEELCPIADWRDMPEGKRKFRQRIYKKLQVQFLKNPDGTISNRSLAPNEFKFCVGAGWITRRKGARGRWEVTDVFREIFEAYNKASA